MKDGLIKPDQYGNFAGGIMKSGAMVSFEGFVIAAWLIIYAIVSSIVIEKKNK